MGRAGLFDLFFGLGATGFHGGPEGLAGSIGVAAIGLLDWGVGSTAARLPAGGEWTSALLGSGGGRSGLGGGAAREEHGRGDEGRSGEGEGGPVSGGAERHRDLR